jgi:DNA-binding IscR family transcriptional regulator
MVWKKLMESKEDVLRNINLQHLVDYENKQGAIEYSI